MTRTETDKSFNAPKRTPTVDSVLSGARVLVIDDNPAILRAIARVLKNAEVTTALGGPLALEMLAENASFDAVVCDVMMPDVSGPQVFAHIQSNYSHLCSRFSFCSAGVRDPELQACIDSLDRPMIPKPFDCTQMRQRVVDLILHGRTTLRSC